MNGLFKHVFTYHSDQLISLSKLILMGLRLTAIKCAGVFLILFQLSLSSHAQQLEQPVGRVILTISGAIGAYNDPAPEAEQDPEQQPSARFDLSMLESLGLTKVNTETPWTDGLVEFEGVLLRDLLEHVKADGKSVQAMALDDYMTILPIEDSLEYDVIVATRIKTKPMRIRDNGPLWVIYPWGDVSALRRPHYYARSIWQLKSLKVLP